MGSGSRAPEGGRRRILRGKSPDFRSHGGRKPAESVELTRVKALQIISELCRGDKSSYHSYELNLILDNASRINVVDHGSLSKLREDANRLAQFLGVPIWDAA